MTVSIKAKLAGLIREATEGLIPADFAFTIERPADLSHGDFSTNVAIPYTKISFRLSSSEVSTYLAC